MAINIVTSDYVEAIEDCCRSGSGSIGMPLAGGAGMCSQQDVLMARYADFLVQSQSLSLTGSFAWHAASQEICCSEQLCRIFALDDNGSVTYASILSRVHPEDLLVFRHGLESLRTENSDIALEFRLLMPNLAVRYVRMAARGSQDPQGRWEYTGAVQDITQHRLCEEALREAKAELAYAARVMSLGALSASIAHEVKQPLSGIITNASTCLRMLSADPPDVAGARETAKRTLRDGNRASDIITRLRALFTKNTINENTVGLNQVAQEALTLALGDLQQRRVRVSTEFADKLPKVRGDRIQLHQVILNLLLNAADAMASVDNRSRRLTIGTQLDSDRCVVLSVQDSGTGIGTHAARLFEPFFTTKSEGMGVGLSVSRDIVERHGGRLWAAQNQGPGATFCFSIPSVQKTISPTLSVESKRRRPHAAGQALLEELRATSFRL